MTVAAASGTGPVDCHDLRVAVVAAQQHEQVMAGLVAGARRALADYRVEQPSVVRVPGAFELPVVTAALVHRGYEAVVALGVVIRGSTPRCDLVCAAATDALARIAVDKGVPVGLGLLMCDSEEQALDRAGLEGSRSDGGYEATSAALHTALTLRRVRRGYEAG